MDYPPVLDVCCGPRGMWFNKHNPLALFCDRRSEDHEAIYPCGKKTASIRPDIVADFTALPFPDETFHLVVMDPPHIAQNSDKGFIVKQYGRLEDGWKPMLERGFHECARVLRPRGTFIFKWNECRIPLREVLPLCPLPPLFGHPSGIKMQTHWVAFLKA